MFRSAGCCRESIRAFALLGDPMPPARIRATVADLFLHVDRR
ncbi:MAG: hypothetical protein RLZZ387_311 [Chloroflexota bacterium]|jgi:hypothetical protein